MRELMGRAPKNSGNLSASGREDIIEKALVLVIVPGFESRVHLLITMWPWKSLGFLECSFLIYNMEIIIIHAR
jgi:hypothetical protein